MKTGIDINANILTWAISRAGFEVQEFISKFPKVKEWLDNTQKPTLEQLEVFSHKVHVPFGYLFLKEPPKEKLPIPFFRTGTTQATSVSINVYDTILLIQRRQEWLKNHLEDSDFETLKFVGKYNGRSNYSNIVADIRRELNLESEWASEHKKIEDALNYLTQKIEELGIIVNFNSVVENNNTRPIQVEECRGFVLVDELAPFLFVNAADSKGAQLFTIVHELAHIWTGKSAGFDFRQLQPADDPIEKLCDLVAAEFLVPENAFLRVWKEKPDIAHLARHFKVSQIVIARRALDLGKINKAQFGEFYKNYIAQLNQKKEKRSSGGDFYATQKKRISLRFAGLVNNAVKQNKLLYRDAYKLTGLKGDTFQKFISKHF